MRGFDPFLPLATREFRSANLTVGPHFAGRKLQHDGRCRIHRCGFGAGCKSLAAYRRLLRSQNTVFPVQFLIGY
jgi:hypothetical protein